MLHFNYHIEGIVQGVGFRPFIYQIAKEHNLYGFVLNTSTGVEISIQGDKKDILSFEKALHVKLPPLARIDYLQKREKELEDFQNFSILESKSNVAKYSLISPDFAMCDDCYKEMHDTTNRRYKYFFTNCTNCGPRYSIVQTVPYDRPNTSMKPFNMCFECESEYKNPLDRRYHAQPISCSKCGPTLSLKDKQGNTLAFNNEAIEELAKLIKKGHIVCMKGMGGFHLICDAKNDQTIQKLREKKKRPSKPFAVMFENIETINKICNLSSFEEKEIFSKQRPIVLVKKDKKSFNLSPLIAPRIDRLGVFLAYTPLHVLLLEELHTPIIATSANNSGEPIITNEDDLLAKLGNIIGYYLDYDREIVNASDDSVMQVIGENTLMMRASRGVTPVSLRYESTCKEKILAVGAHQKNAIALYFNNQIVLSPFIGDLDNIASVEFFKKTLQTFKNFYDFEPDIIVGDKHPLYESTLWAKKQQKPFFQVQHHFAHIVATMFEHDIDEKVLGIAWDGTGYGDDGTIWGGEFFLCDRKEYERVFHFDTFSLLGGDASIKDIKRIALSMILDLDEDEEYKTIYNLFTKSEIHLLKQIHKKNLNSPKCSAVGRLFDAVAVICGICDKVTYDGESGLLLESFYDKNIQQAYEFEIRNDTIYYKHTIKEMLQDKEPKIIASKFINALINIIYEISKKYDYKIIISGGVFQNRTLLENLLSKLPNIRFPNHYPINDGSIAMGQLVNFLEKK